MQAALDDMSGGHAIPTPVHVLPDTAARSEVALHRLGVSTLRCDETADSPAFFRCFPWAGVASRSGVPYLVVVRWEYVAFPTSGHGNITTFFCFFGLRVRVSERGMWVA